MILTPLHACAIKPAAGGEWELILWTTTPFQIRHANPPLLHP